MFLILLTGCQQNTNASLSTKNLTKVEAEEENLPQYYEAATTEEALDALPFKLTLPTELPFNAEPFQPTTIADLNRDGNNIMIQFRAVTKNPNDKNILFINASYPIVEMEVPQSQAVQLHNGITGYYVQNTVSFQQNDVTIDVVYVNEDLTEDEQKAALVTLANQMIEAENEGGNSDI